MHIDGVPQTSTFIDMWMYIEGNRLRQIELERKRMTKTEMKKESDE